ncbi:hypothetical protein [Nitrosococcus wardiae]|uniref:Uncharacterized protein n=1 Tax=Nitrosococcus wardiae TaxID=1814290 RepID=A0A4P7BWC3_9GAMM|nr:hypothetical protein [Nitrosococcus wardiae]QBQ53394.1 hypothetical protein E3U44_01885 [Nitrosococcus wardiae]
MDKDWRRISSIFTVAEIAAFLIGEEFLRIRETYHIEDEKLKQGEQIDKYWQEQHDKFNRAVDVIIRAIEAGDLKAVNVKNEAIREYADPQTALELPIHRQSYEQWAIEHDLLIPYLSPEERAALAEGKGNGNSHQIHGNTQHNARKNFEILQAALWCLAKFPEQCRGKNEQVSAAKLAKLVEQKSGLFWKDGEPPRAEKTIERLISRALKIVK